ncbi:MAG: hypothetical protein JOZ75_10685 [Candidatus Dormibacteraeota bacterium]|nr:hypothetical protein [Candidatus Dormibacteraeota bacterium]
MATTAANTSHHAVPGPVSQRSTAAFRRAWNDACRRIAREQRETLEALAAFDRGDYRLRDR